MDFSRDKKSLSPWWVQTTWFSLEAPLVAVAWLHLIAHSLGFNPVGRIEALLGLSVWMIYCADRLLDAYSLPHSISPLYRFYRSCSKPFVIGLALLSILGVFLLSRNISSDIMYLELPLVVCMCFYFLKVYRANRNPNILWPKEMIMGMLFSAGVCIPVYAQVGAHPRLIVDYLFLSLLVTLNSSGIKVLAMHSGVARHSITRWLGTHLTIIALLIFFTAVIYQLLHEWRPVLSAVMVSSILLAALPNFAKRWRTELWSLAADAAMCSPLLIPAFWR